MKTDKRTVLARMKKVRAVVEAEISGNRGGEGPEHKFSRGLAREGFAGGYIAALDDIQAALEHGYPSDHRRYWQAAEAAGK